MAFLEWLEFTALADWVATSEWGYAITISCHAVGLAVVVGIASMIDLRVLGFFKSVKIEPMLGLLKVAWAGFMLNAVSGFALFSSQATYFITHSAFLIKISAILIAVLVTVFLGRQLRAHGEGENRARLLALVSLALWSTAIIAGRLIAYL